MVQAGLWSLAVAAAIDEDAASCRGSTLGLHDAVLDPDLPGLIPQQSSISILCVSDLSLLILHCIDHSIDMCATLMYHGHVFSSLGSGNCSSREAAARAAKFS